MSLVAVGLLRLVPLASCGEKSEVEEFDVDDDEKLGSPSVKKDDLDVDDDEKLWSQV